MGPVGLASTSWPPCSATVPRRLNTRQGLSFSVFFKGKERRYRETPRRHVFPNQGTRRSSRGGLDAKRSGEIKRAKLLRLCATAVRRLKDALAGSGQGWRRQPREPPSIGCIPEYPTVTPVGAPCDHQTFQLLTTPSLEVCRQSTPRLLCGRSQAILARAIIDISGSCPSFLLVEKSAVGLQTPAPEL